MVSHSQNIAKRRFGIRSERRLQVSHFQQRAHQASPPSGEGAPG